MKLVSTFLLCLFCLVASAQNDTTKYFRSLDYGWSYKRLQAREAFIMPVDTFVNKLGMALLNNKLYSGNGIKWTLINGGGGGSSTDTTSLSNRINLKIDSLKKSNDSIYYWANGNRTFSYKDNGGGGGSTDTTSLSNRINLKIDSLKKSNDSIYYWANGNRTFSYKDNGGGGGSTDTTSLSNRINLKIDSLKRFNDTVYIYKNESRLFAFKDSVGTNPAPVGYYGSFYDTTIQTAAAINTPYAMKLSNTDLSNGISISNNSRINIAHTGVYNIQFSAQFDRTNSGTDVIDIWLRKNGINVTGSGGKIVLSGGAVASQLIASWNYVLNAIDNDYFEIMWSSPDTHVRLLSEVTQTSPFAHPNIPSVILTVTQQSGIMAGTGIQAADTVSLSNRINLKLNATDTASLSNRINLKLNATDTASLSNRINTKLSPSDTASLSNRINTKLSPSDTASLSNRINAKLSPSDTTSLSNRINAKLSPSDTTSLSNRINLKMNQSMSSYTFMANNTTATANATAQIFRDSAQKAYTGTITWSGTGPTGTTNHTYHWSQIGKLVTLRINLVYSSQGGSNTQVVATLPSDCPAPEIPTGISGANSILYFINGCIITTSTSTAPTTAASTIGYMKINSSNNGYEFLLLRATSSAIAAYFTINYFAQ